MLRSVAKGKPCHQHDIAAPLQKGSDGFPVHHAVKRERHKGVREIGGEGLCEGSVHDLAGAYRRRLHTYCRASDPGGGPQGAGGQCYYGDRIP